jgi:integrase
MNETHENEMTVAGVVVDRELTTHNNITFDDKEKLLGVMQLATTDSTKKSYRDNLSKFERENEIPANPVTVGLWLIKQMENRLEVENKPYKRTTLKAWITAIRIAHLARGYPDPTDSPVVTQTLEGLCRKYEGISTQKRAKSLSKTEILSMVKKCKSNNSTKDLRDKILIVLGTTGGFRINELLTLKVTNIIASQYEGFKGYEIIMGKTKTDQRGDKGFKKLIPFEGKTISPATLLKEWLDLIGNEGYLIRGVECNGKIDTKHLEYDAALAALQLRAQQAKIKDWQLVTTHSMRRSFVTQAYKRGYTNQQIAKQTNQAVSTVNRYIDDYDVYEKNPVLKMW